MGHFEVGELCVVLGATYHIRACGRMGRIAERDDAKSVALVLNHGFVGYSDKFVMVIVNDRLRYVHVSSMYSLDV